MAGCGRWTQNIILNQTSKVFTYKTALVLDSKIIIFHLNKHNNHQIILYTNSLVTSFTLNDIENIAFWTDSKIILTSPINTSINIKVIIFVCVYIYIKKSNCHTIIKMFFSFSYIQL